MEPPIFNAMANQSGTSGRIWQALRYVKGVVLISGVYFTYRMWKKKKSYKEMIVEKVATDGNYKLTNGKYL